MGKLIIIAVLLFTCASCARKQERHYQLSGKIVALNAGDQTATIDAAAIPNFMEAMTMDYPVKSKTDFNSLHVGDKIKAIVNVRDDGYDLSNVQAQK
ncbi:MAG: copper-binding protein [Bryobacteraceae bacterium]